MPILGLVNEESVKEKERIIIFLRVIHNAKLFF